MLKPENLRNYQQKGVEHICRHRRCGLWARMGMGKTATVLTALERLNLVEDVYPALVIAPLRVAQSTWPEEPVKWHHLNHMKISVVTGDLKRRKERLSAPAQVYTINYEQLTWLAELYGKKWPFKTIIADESTKLKGYRTRQGGKRARMLAAVSWLPNVTRFINLTGTPSPNGLSDLWGQTWFLDQGERLGRTFSAFEKRWFTTGYNGYNIVPFEHSQKEIEDKLKDICLSFNPSDYFDLREPVNTTVYVDMPDIARKLYRDMERDMFMEIENEGVEAFNAAGKTNKCLQLANGAVYVGENAKNWQEVHKEKLYALESIVEESAGMPVLVAYNFVSDVDRLRQFFPSGRVLDKSEQTIRDWNKGKIPLLFAHPASAGHGLNLQDGGNILVFFGSNWNLELDQQIIERIGPVRQLQAGHDRNVFIYRIVARDTVEEDVIERLKTKASLQDILMEAMKRRSNNET